jgi:hypothetical protein
LRRKKAAVSAAAIVPRRLGGGHLPARGPAPAKAPSPARARQSAPATENHIAVHQKGHPDLPHVDTKGDKWVGHDTGANDPHDHLAQPWAHGHFTGGFGPQHLFVLTGGGPQRFWFNNFFWDVAAFDYNIVAGWNWAGDQIAIYVSCNDIWGAAFAVESKSTEPFTTSMGRFGSAPGEVAALFKVSRATLSRALRRCGQSRSVRVDYVCSVGYGALMR